MIHAFSLVLDRANQTQEKHIRSIKLGLERQKKKQKNKNSPTTTELASNSKQNQDTPCGTLKLPPFRLPRDNLKRHMTFFFPPFLPLLPLFPPTVTRCLTGRCGSWQTGFVTCSKSVTADCTGLILTNSQIEWVESPAPPLHSHAGGGEAAFSGAAKTRTDSSTTSPRYVSQLSASGQNLVLHLMSFFTQLVSGWDYYAVRSTTRPFRLACSHAAKQMVSLRSWS